MNIPSTLGAHDTLPQLKALHAHLDDLAAMQSEREAAEQALETQFLLAASMPSLLDLPAEFSRHSNYRRVDSIADALFDYEPDLRAKVTRHLCSLAIAGDPAARELIDAAAREYAVQNAEV